MIVENVRIVNNKKWWHDMVHMLKGLSAQELKTEVVIPEKVKVHREELIKKMTKEAYKECKEKIRDEGTLVGTGCVCKKLIDKEWQRKFIA